MLIAIHDVKELLLRMDLELSKAREKEHGWKAAAKRARKTSLELEKALKRFRAASCAEAQNAGHIDDESKMS